MALKQITVPKDCDMWENKHASCSFEERVAGDAIGAAGVGIAKKYKQHVEFVFTKRFVVVVVSRFGARRIAAASIYLPVRMQNLDEVQERLGYVTEEIHRHQPDIIMCAGDFNCGMRNYVDLKGMSWAEERVGCRHTDLVSDLVVSMGLCAQTNSAKEVSSTRCTWSLPRKRTQIDFWMKKRAERRNFTTLPDLPTERSDHCLLMMA